jgi:predicted RNA binding protein with dsRBD fold (UPF0201 family)
MDDLTIHVEVEINPTETEDKVKQAVENMFGPMKVRTKPLRKGFLLKAEAKGQETLIKLRNLLQREHIRAAARSVLIRGTENDSVSFCLNKQVAFAGHVSFATEPNESPLGPVRVEIRTEDLRRIIEYLTAY